MVALEGRGIDADHIHVVGAPPAVATQDATRGAELAATGDVARRSAVGGAIGAALGAAVLAVIVAFAGPDPVGPAVGFALLTGGIGGFLLGGFWGGASKLAVNEETFDTYLADPRATAPIRVEVRLGHPGAVDAVAELLRSHDARNVERVPT